MRIAAMLFLGFYLVACTDSHPQSASLADPVSSFSFASGQAIHWKALLIAGDNSIANFDRATDDFSTTLEADGIADQVILTSSERELGAGKVLATPDNAQKALMHLRPAAGDGCLVFMTSHGSRSGLYLANKSSAKGIWHPDEVGALLDEYCGSLPTVLIVSACYSGVFLDDDLKQPNRIILTAARRDRSSFGCSADTTYTYYDACLLENWRKSQSWEGLYRNNRDCITAREQELDVHPSEPQVFIGAQMKNLRLPHAG